MKKYNAAIGLLILPVGLHAKYPWNVIAMGVAIAGVVLELVINRERYNSWSAIGFSCFGVGGSCCAAAVAGKTILNMPDLTQEMLGMAIVFFGLALMGIGEHLKNPEKVTRKTLYRMACGYVLLGVMVSGIWLL